MDATVVAIAGIGRTLAASLLSPIVAGRAQRAALREERILDRRLDAYTDLLETARHLHDNAQEWSAIPLAELEEPLSERLRQIDAHIRTVASHDVFQAMLVVSRLLTRFQRQLWPARLRHQRDEDDTHADTVEAIAARMGLGGIAEEITTAVDDLEATIDQVVAGLRAPASPSSASVRIFLRKTSGLTQAAGPGWSAVTERRGRPRCTNGSFRSCSGQRILNKTPLQLTVTHRSQLPLGDPTQTSSEPV